MSKVETFHYEPSDFSYTIESNHVDSKFDKILMKKWTEAEEDGILRYKLKIEESKILAGPCRILVQLNLDRANNRRDPQNIESMSQPFDRNRFNFTQLPSNEILLDLGDGTGNDVIAANVSPFGRGHCLFIPERFACLPQIMTQSSLFKMMEIMLLSNSPYFRAVFNSLCAHASVNHLHWHFYYLEEKMLLEDIVLEEFEDPIYVFENYPVRGFCLKLSRHERNLKLFGGMAFLVIKELQQNNVAHNVCITRAKSQPDQEIYDDIRVYIWARQACSGVKNVGSLIPGVCELFGHVTVATQEEFDSLSENDVISVLDQVTKDIYPRVRDCLRHRMLRLDDMRTMDGTLAEILYRYLVIEPQWRFKDFDDFFSS